MTETEPNEDSAEMDKLLAELESETLPEGSEIKPIVEKQIQKNKDEENDDDETDAEMEKFNSYDDSADFMEGESGVQGEVIDI